MSPGCFTVYTVTFFSAVRSHLSTTIVRRLEGSDKTQYLIGQALHTSFACSIYKHRGFWPWITSPHNWCHGSSAGRICSKKWCWKLPQGTGNENIIRIICTLPAHFWGLVDIMNAQWHEMSVILRYRTNYSFVMLKYIYQIFEHYFLQQPKQNVLSALRKVFTD